MAQGGMVGDVLPYLHLDESSSFPYLFNLVAMAARTPAQRQILRDWLLAHDGPTSSEKWKLLAIAETLNGEVPKARADYSHATPSPMQKVTRAQDVSAVYELALANAWNDDALRSEAEARLRVQMAGIAQAGDVEGMILSARLLSWENGTAKLRPMTREELMNATDKVVAFSPEKADLGLLRVMGEEWHSRGDNEQVVRVARAIAEAEHALSTMPKGQSSNGWESFWFSEDTLQGAAWLRLAGEKAEANAAAQQFARDAPARFRVKAAIILWKSGFPKVAETIFDPLAELSHPQPRSGAQRQNLLVTGGADQVQAQWEQIRYWEELTAAQAQFVAPDAPARWFGKLPSVELKAHVLAAWIKALSPALPDESLSLHYSYSGG